MTSWRDMTDRISGKAPKGATRSSQWTRTRNEFLRGKSCVVCGGKINLIAHHVIPFHLAPDLELDPDNLIAMCESERFGINCHLLIGHVGNWSRSNPIVIADAAYWRERLQ